MGIITALTLFVIVNTPHHYFHCQYPMDQMVAKDLDLVSTYNCTPDLYHLLHQEEKKLGD